jgi:hypothetical protein
MFQGANNFFLVYFFVKCLNMKFIFLPFVLYRQRILDQIEDLIITYNTNDEVQVKISMSLNLNFKL